MLTKFTFFYTVYILKQFILANRARKTSSISNVCTIFEQLDEFGSVIGSGSCRTSFQSHHVRRLERSVQSNPREYGGNSCRDDDKNERGLHEQQWILYDLLSHVEHTLRRDYKRGCVIC